MRDWLHAGFDRRQYLGVVAASNVCVHPVDFLRRYAGARSQYPASVELRTPTGRIALDLYSWHDAGTIHEIFLVEDYHISGSERVIVDYGSNIGVSAAYFLSRDPASFAYLFEPVPKNVERLRKNLRQFEGRFELQEVAVALKDGTVRFGVEETGRYGGVNRETGEYMEVESRDSTKILSDIIAKHGVIDVLKIDVETLERDLVEHLPADLASKIRLLFVEVPFASNVLASTHRFSAHRTVTQFQLAM
jgi:FkbM family methyltransferase